MSCGGRVIGEKETFIKCDAGLGHCPHSAKVKFCSIVAELFQRVSYGSSLQEIQQQHRPSLISRVGVWLFRFLGCGLCRLPLTLYDGYEYASHTGDTFQPSTS